MTYTKKDIVREILHNIESGMTLGTLDILELLGATEEQVEIAEELLAELD